MKVIYTTQTREEQPFLLIRRIFSPFFNFFFCHLDPHITRMAGTDRVLPLCPKKQEGVCLNMQVQRQDLCILYRKLLLFAASRIHNVLSTGDQDVGLYKHQAAIPYITSPRGELCVMRRNSFARKGKTQEAMWNSWKKTRGWWKTQTQSKANKFSVQIISRQRLRAGSQSIHCLLQPLHP